MYRNVYDEMKVYKKYRSYKLLVKQFIKIKENDYFNHYLIKETSILKQLITFCSNFQNIPNYYSNFSSNKNCIVIY